jgi:hypothetical protein
MQPTSGGGRVRRVATSITAVLPCMRVSDATTVHVIDDRRHVTRAHINEADLSDGSRA